MKKVTIKNKPIFQFAFSILLPLVLYLLNIKYWYFTLIFTVLMLLVFIKTPNTKLLSIENKQLIFYDENNNEDKKVSFDDVIYWNRDENFNGNIAIVYTENKQQQVISINSPNGQMVSFVLDHYLKNKNYKLHNWNAPFKAVGDKAFKRDSK